MLGGGGIGGMLGGLFSDRRLKKNDVVRIPPLTITEKKASSPSKSLESLLKRRIIYNKDSILIIDKPEGLASHGGSGLKLGLIESARGFVHSIKTNFFLIGGKK